MRKPPPSCISPLSCKDIGVLDRCRPCVESFYWSEGLTVEQGDAWREEVINPTREPCVSIEAKASGEIEVSGADSERVEIALALTDKLFGNGIPANDID